MRRIRVHPSGARWVGILLMLHIAVATALPSTSAAATVDAPTCPRESYKPTLKEYEFTCSGGQKIGFKCMDGQAPINNICKGIDVVDITNVNCYDGDAGYDVCAMTGCLHTTCSDSRYSEFTMPGDLLDDGSNWVLGCTCYTSDFRIPPLSEQNHLPIARYTREHPNYPKDDPECSEYEKCTQEDSALVLSSSILSDKPCKEKCCCKFPANFAQVPERQPDLIAYATPRKKLPTTTTTTTTTAAPTVPPDVPVLSFRRFRTLFLNMPRALPEAVYLYEKDTRMCCTTFPGLNQTMTACGDWMLDLPVGWFYCRSTIPSFEFCSEVERLPGGVYAFRGERCNMFGA